MIRFVICSVLSMLLSIAALSVATSAHAQDGGTTAPGGNVAVAVAPQPAPSAMGKAEIWAALAPLIAAILGLAGAGIAYARSALKLKQLQADAAAAELEAAHARRAAQAAQEARLAQKKDGAWAEQQAVEDFRRRVPGATEQSAKDAVRAAVAELPGYGETGKVETGKIIRGELLDTLKPYDKKDGDS